jgi:hypothetical protein
MNELAIYPFNNAIETGLRSVIILAAGFPKRFDVDHLLYLDYLMVHSGDVDLEKPSLHAPVPNRMGEVLVRRSLVQAGLQLFIQKNIITLEYSNEGIIYSATDSAVPFLDALSEIYSMQLMDRAAWVMDRFQDYTVSQFRALMEQNSTRLKNEFNFELIRK